MKKIILILFFIFSSGLAIAQTTNVTYSREGSLLNKPMYDEANLYFNDTVSVFSYARQTPENAEISIQISTGAVKKIKNPDDHIGTYQYINYNKQKLFERRNIRRNYFIIKENLDELDWQLLDSTKQITGYTCQLATTKCYGRKFFAWYTVAIPSDKGPWKLCGLPGLILHAYDEAKKLEWKATKLKFDFDFDFNVFLHNEEQITLAKYYEIEKENFQKRKRKLEALAAQMGGSVAIKKIHEEDIELSKTRIKKTK